MKAFLLYRDSDPAQADLPLPPNAPELINDLALNPVIEAMADGDEFLRDVALRTVMASMSAPDDIIYRQQILVDCLEHPGTVRKLYGLAVEAVEAEKKIYRSIFNNYPEAVLGRSIESLNALMAVLRHLRRLAADALQDFTSPGMRRFFTMITDELSDEYFDAVDIHLRRLKFRGGVEISAGLGTANEAPGTGCADPRRFQAAGSNGSCASGSSRTGQPCPSRSPTATRAVTAPCQRCGTAA